jgi:hypothetical protein
LNIPLLDLNLALAKRENDPSALLVHPFDTSLNEIAHGVAAEETGRFLLQRHLLATE